MTHQCTPGSEVTIEDDTEVPVRPDPATMRPTLQASLWLFDLIANSQLKKTKVTMKGPSLNQQRVKEEMATITQIAQNLSDTPKELSLVALYMARIMIAIVRLTIHMGTQSHLRD